jgi:hypothetical protein
MIAHDAEAGNAPPLDSLLVSLVAFVRAAAAAGTPAHLVERQLFSGVLGIGREAFSLFLRLSGTGDLGETLAVNGRTLRRLDGARPRPYRSVFGDFCISRACYGSREGQRIDFAPLDNRLELPQGDYSHLLQEWDATLGCESAFARVAATLGAMLGVEQPVDSLERCSRHMAEAVAPFRESRPLPAPGGEGEIFVVSDDAKGVVMRRAPGEAKPRAHRKRGDKANKKRMAVVGAVYSVGRFARTPEEVTACLFRDPRRPGEGVRERPGPVGKHVWASLSTAADGNQSAPIEEVFGWQKKELDRRNPGGAKEVVSVMDGQPNLWRAKAEHFGGGGRGGAGHPARDAPAVAGGAPVLRRGQRRGQGFRAVAGAAGAAG